MTVKEAIERGKEIAAGTFLRSLEECAIKIYEILGYTNSKYIGYSKIAYIRSDENRGEKHIYYQYVCHKLVKCSFKQALITPDYKKFKIFIYSIVYERYNRDGSYTRTTGTPMVTLIEK